MSMSMVLNKPDYTPWQEFHTNPSKYHNIPKKKNITDLQIPHDLTQGGTVVFLGAYPHNSHFITCV